MEDVIKGIEGQVRIEGRVLSRLGCQDVLYLDLIASRFFFFLQRHFFWNGSD